jgi:hypothetical protein
MLSLSTRDKTTTPFSLMSYPGPTYPVGGRFISGFCVMARGQISPFFMMLANVHDSDLLTDSQ